MIKLSDLESCARRATPGPWVSGIDDGWPVGTFKTGCSGQDGLDYQVWTKPMPSSELYAGDTEADAKTDAAYIASANPDTVLKLCAALREAERVLQKMVGIENVMGMASPCTDALTKIRQEVSFE